MRWLSAGFNDMRHAPIISLNYGMFITLIIFAVVQGGNKYPILSLSFASAFLIISPLVAIGVILGMLAVFWGRIAGIAIALSLPSLGYNNITAGLFGWNALFTHTPNGWLYISLPLTIGFAASAFAIAVLALPMLYHRPLDPVTAIMQSLKTVRRSWYVMMVWGSIITLAIFTGIAAGYIALIVIMPILAHASWHCYRQLTG